MNIIDEIFGNSENPGLIEEIKYNIKNVQSLLTEDKNKYRGSYGEWLTEYKIEKNITGYYQMFKNIYVPYLTKDKEERTTEIDIIIIHETGLYIIESKNYSGWIFGSENQKMWTQCLPDRTRKQFYNPIRQNRTHIDILSKHIKINKERMKSFIVFSERCELKKVPKSTETFTIVKRENFTKAITNEISKKEITFTKKQVDFISSKIAKLTNASNETKEQHIKNITNS